ncbi:MAG: hypothetical protein IT443_03745 [Phycisphaeraceae bacterium]|nr:hypothetical protein [Phycisphaeraceae bacterium]
MNELATMLVLAQSADGYRLSAGGWVVMILSVGFVTLLLAWCIWKVLATPGETNKLHAQADIDPHDADAE